jgi:peptidoglycan/LPS O-acetylase OafA/YrhL
MNGLSHPSLAMQNELKKLINDKNKILLLIDGIAIIFIVLDHQIVDNYIPMQSNFYQVLVQYLPIFGLSLFTFSSGYKLVISHLGDMGRRDFLGGYFYKRFIRLYKPYLGYILLLIIVYFLITILADICKVHFFTFGAVDLFNYLSSPQAILATVLGQPDIVKAWQLWYLIALIAITATCFTILYFTDIRTLFFFAVPLLIFDVVFWNDLQSNTMLFNIMAYMVIYISGIYYGYTQKKSPQKSHSITVAVSVLFVGIFLLNVLSRVPIWNYSILVYGLTLPYFMMLISPLLLRVRYLGAILLTCGAYSFYIYLFHLPLILIPLDILIVKGLHIFDITTPLVISALTMLACIFVYGVMKKFRLNALIE